MRRAVQMEARRSDLVTSPLMMMEVIKKPERSQKRRQPDKASSK